MTDRLLGVVLCGGKSSRMGRDKAALPYGGTTFLQHAIARLKNLCDEVVLSGETAAEYHVRSIPDSVAGAGPAGGVAASLEDARQRSHNACLFTPIDVPRLDESDLQRIVQVWQSAQQLTLARSDRTEPLIGVYPVSLAEAVAGLAASEARSLSRWLQSQPHQSVSIAADHLQNINTPDEYHNHAR